MTIWCHNTANPQNNALNVVYLLSTPVNTKNSKIKNLSTFLGFFATMWQLCMVPASEIIHYHIYKSILYNFNEVIYRHSHCFTLR